MSRLSQLIRQHSELDDVDREWLMLLLADSQLLADMALADLVMWVRDHEGNFVAISQVRPASAPTLFYRDLIGQRVREQWEHDVRACYEEGITRISSTPDWFDEIPAQLTTTPVFSKRAEGDRLVRSASPIAIISRHTNVARTRQLTRQEVTFRECADDMFDMIQAGDFPDIAAPDFSRRGAPRASDGMIRLNVDGVVTFASPNALSAMNKLGFGGELEGEVFAEVASMLLDDKRNVSVDEALPLVVAGQAPCVSDVNAKGVTVTMRSLPLYRGGERIGAVVLCRDTTDVRHQQQELITKDATIREIHHRVKNNLQTVAALLRIQARRARSDEARESLLHAMRRVSSIAVVHDTLSGGFSQSVNFDEVFTRVMRLATEVATGEGAGQVRPVLRGSFGAVPSEYATPLALALTELITNAVEHGFADGVSAEEPGEISVEIEPNEEFLDIHVRDNGCGFTGAPDASGLGTQIVRTLVEGELGGQIAWNSIVGTGTTVEISIPKRWGVNG
ncbi:sensor histidine kinase [Gulosibacter bifidus]|uniref:histidine kinase n=1 Tax=Gulosibacter bifidus TaxID=272239 RepID=A0ABW5RKQ0_9MICO|nr:PAS domain-containing sensor histidine kinase [Gulosibacter bifidus]